MPALLRAGDCDADRRADVGGGEQVALRRSAPVMSAQLSAAAVAALPLVAEGRRRAAGPAARVGGHRLALLHRPVHRRRDRVLGGDRRRRDRAGGRGGGGGVAGAVAAGDLDADRRADVGGCEQVALPGLPGDVGAVEAAAVAALPLVAEGRGGAAGPAARVGGHRLALLHRPVHRRRDRVLGGDERHDRAPAEVVELRAAGFDRDVARAAVRVVDLVAEPRPRSACRGIPRLDRRTDDGDADAISHSYGLRERGAERRCSSTVDAADRPAVRGFLHAIARA